MRARVDAVPYTLHLYMVPSASEVHWMRGTAVANCPNGRRGSAQQWGLVFTASAHLARTRTLATFPPDASDDDFTASVAALCRGRALSRRGLLEPQCACVRAPAPRTSCPRPSMLPPAGDSCIWVAATKLSFRLIHALLFKVMRT